jgi:hypothetical protein
MTFVNYHLDAYDHGSAEAARLAKEGEYFETRSDRSTQPSSMATAKRDRPEPLSRSDVVSLRAL